MYVFVCVWLLATEQIWVLHNKKYLHTFGKFSQVTFPQVSFSRLRSILQKDSLGKRLWLPVSQDRNGSYLLPCTPSNYYFAGLFLPFVHCSCSSRQSKQLCKLKKS